MEELCTPLAAGMEAGLDLCWVCFSGGLKTSDCVCVTWRKGCGLDRTVRVFEILALEDLCHSIIAFKVHVVKKCQSCGIVHVRAV